MQNTSSRNMPETRPIPSGLGVPLAQATTLAEPAPVAQTPALPTMIGPPAEPRIAGIGPTSRLVGPPQMELVGPRFKLKAVDAKVGHDALTDRFRALQQAWRNMFAQTVQQEAIPGVGPDRTVQIIPSSRLLLSLPVSQIRQRLGADAQQRNEEVTWVESSGTVQILREPLGINDGKTYNGWRRSNIGYELQVPIITPDGKKVGSGFLGKGLEILRKPPLNAQAARELPPGSLFTLQGTGFYGNAEHRLDDGGPDDLGGHRIWMYVDILEDNKVRVTGTFVRDRWKILAGLGGWTVSGGFKTKPISVNGSIDIFPRYTETYEFDLNHPQGALAYERMLSLQSDEVGQMAKEQPEATKEVLPTAAERNFSLAVAASDALLGLGHHGVVLGGEVKSQEILPNSPEIQNDIVRQALVNADPDVRFVQSLAMMRVGAAGYVHQFHGH